MNSQIVFSGENKKSVTSVLFAELAQRVVKVKKNICIFRLAC